MPVTALVGAQWGSEGKGVIAGHIASRFDVAVRTGGPNAGHSLKHEGQVYKMRGVPCGWVNPDCELVIGAGAVVDPVLLAEELAGLPLSQNRGILVDRQAVLALEDHRREEEQAMMSERIGSTTEGVGAARIDKIKRRGAVLARDWQHWPGDVALTDTSQYLHQRGLDGAQILLEGTQGSGLSLHHGTWPYVTSTDTNASGLAADAGVPPSAVEHVYLVARTYPIRVAGNSGPMGTEVDWSQLPVEQPERTTVTNKVRRIATWSDDVFGRAVTLNAPCGVFLTFADYLAPQLAGNPDGDVWMADQWTRGFVRRIESGFGVPVLALGVGGPDWAVAPLRRSCAHGRQWQ